MGPERMMVSKESEVPPAGSGRPPVGLFARAFEAESILELKTVPFAR
jgi:hypothetical protein